MRIVENSAGQFEVEGELAQVEGPEAGYITKAMETLRSRDADRREFLDACDRALRNARRGEL